jgi:hypothetical protein
MEEINEITNKTNIDIKEECHELKNIKYKTMLLNGNSLTETKSSNDLLNLDKFLENEKNTNNSEPWCKLNKTIKTKKLLEYVEIYKKEKNLQDDEAKLLIAFLKDSLDRKKLLRVKDVIYDKNTGTIKDIPALTFTKANKHFTLKNMDKRVSTLKSLAIKKGTIKNKETEIKEDDESEDES